MPLAFDFATGNLHDLVSPLLTSSDGVNMLTGRRVVKPGSELSVAQTIKIRLR